MLLVGDVVDTPARIDEHLKKKYGVEHARYDFCSLAVLDAKLAALCASIDVDVMPGARDPTNATLPQQPIHAGLFPLASTHSAFHPVMNPHLFEFEGLRVLATAGQNLDDVFRFSDIDERLDIAERMLVWRNIAPTAPDTLWCFPFYDRDPFVLAQTPDVLLIGNQPAFQTRTIRRPDGSPVLIVLLPKFADAPCAVLLNAATLTCECISLA